ncbi:hypothetical protein ACFVS2_19750 [Brevibacillus sp. NPDC058079]|uniref:hypothetical protein n=1 Tax=Brevibacillus sp. NPDC058079 TaxID=3346330 RepID=UPI0036E26451
MLNHKKTVVSLVATAVLAISIPLSASAAWSNVKAVPKIGWQGSKTYYKAVATTTAKIKGSKGSNEQLYLAAELAKDAQWYDSNTGLYESSSGEVEVKSSREVDAAEWRNIGSAAIWDKKKLDYIEFHEMVDLVDHPGIKNDNMKHLAAYQEYKDKEISNHLTTIYEEIQNSLNINTDEYDLFQRFDFTMENSTLSMNEYGKFIKALHESIYQPKKIESGDSIPGIYLHHDKSEIFVVFKSQDGNNHIYQFLKDSEGNWDLAESEESQGKKLKQLELKSQEEFINEISEN